MGSCYAYVPSCEGYTLVMYRYPLPIYILRVFVYPLQIHIRTCIYIYIDKWEYTCSNMYLYRGESMQLYLVIEDEN